MTNGDNLWERTTGRIMATETSNKNDDEDERQQSMSAVNDDDIR